MAYSLSPITVERFRPYLDPLLGSSEVIWRTRPGRARWLAYRIREALRVARSHEDRFPELARLDVKVEVLSTERVRARPRIREEVEIEPISIETVRVAAEVGSQSVGNIQRRWELRSPMEDRLHFPDAGLQPDGLRELHAWAQEHEVLLFESMGSLTLVPLRGNEDAAEFAFTPEDLNDA